MAIYQEFNDIFVLLIVLFLGYLIARFKLLNKKEFESIPKLLFQVAYPALILHSTTSINLDGLLYNSLFVIITTLIFTIAIYLVGHLLMSRYETIGRKEIILFQLMVGNVTFIGLPVVKIFFGEVGIYYAVIHGLAQDIILWTLIYWMFSKKDRVSLNLKSFFTPCIIALFVSVLIIVFKLNVPVYVNESVEMISKTSLPLALLFMGSTFNNNSLKAWIPKKENIIVMMIKLFIIPVIIYGALYLTGIQQNIIFILAILFGLPAPITSTVFAKQFNKDYLFAIKGVLLSTTVYLISFCVVYLIF